MRQLRFVRPGEDPDHVVLATADGAEQFVLHVDTAMRDAVRTDLRRVSTPSTPEVSAIGPREIQMRVRAGEAPQELAEQNAMTLEKVMRFAGPVLAERARMADEARRARARRSTTEGQTVVFGEAVDERFGAHGIDATAVRWDAHRREDGQWIIGARWLGGDADRLAEWVFHLVTRTVTPIDDTAADLLSDRPIRATVTAPPAPPSLSTAPPLAPGVVAFPAMPDAHTSRLPNLDEVYDQDAIDRDAPRPAARSARHTTNVPQRAAEPVSEPVSVSVPEEYDAPLLPLRLADPTAPDPTAAEPTEAVAQARPERAAVTRTGPRRANLGVAVRGEETEEQRAERSRIPSWDDIMLGVRRKSD